MKHVLLLLCVVLSATASAQVDLSRGLVAYYPFNGNANDESGNGLNGIEHNGVQLTTDKYGNTNSAYAFDGVDDFIEVLDDPRLRFSDSFSVCISYLKFSYPGGNLIEKREYNTGRNTSFDMATGPYGANGAMKSDNRCDNATSSADYTMFTQPPALNRWYCIVMTFCQGTLKYYEDGILISSTTTYGTRVDSCAGSNIRIGHHLSFDPIWMHGKIDEVRLYNRAINIDEVRSYCDVYNPPNCLRIPGYNTTDYVSIGDLDVTGNQITVEALFNADTNYFIPGTVSYDIVSKHTGTANCNYLLRPVSAEITTTNGFFQVLACDYLPKKTHHVALVYDGSTLKFYRNGYLMGSKPATGNLVTNDLITKIGNYSFGSLNGSLKGYINEVRIWNVARTQQEIRNNMAVSLTNPAIQPGLLAYYVFDNLLNKKGNGLYNGTLHGNAQFGIASRNAAVSSDSCLIVTPVNITSVNAAVAGKKIIINWQLENEIGIEKYFIERAPNAAGPFVTVGNIAATNSGTAHSYSFTDNTVVPGKIYYYRIRIVERNGIQKNSVVKYAMVNNGSLYVNVFPNPVADNLVVQLNSNAAAEIKIYNYSGQLLIQQKAGASAGLSSYRINTASLAKGMYFVQVTTGNETVTKKIEKL